MSELSLVAPLTLDALRPFCGTDLRPGPVQVRGEYLHTPSTVGRYTYATNDYVAIRVDAIAECGRAEGFADRFADTIDRSVDAAGVEFVPLTLPAPPASWPKCEACEGGGEVMPCHACNGLGEAECNLGHWHSCEVCFSGFIAGAGRRCDSCYGLGKHPGPKVADRAVLIGDGWFDWRLLNLFARLPNVEIGIDPASTVPDGGAYKPRAIVRFDGGRGVVQPINYKGSRQDDAAMRLVTPAERAS